MSEHTLAVFIAELIALLICGRVLGEIFNRVGQPSIFGQLLAGVLLGPSVLGALLPAWQKSLFPGTPDLKSMVDAVAQIGILLLLLLTGMETNLQLLRRRRRAVVSTTLLGIAVPFACGFAMAYLMPARLFPSPALQFASALFLGTALSISSVKIVAMVLMEVDAIRRDIGQMILATAILDDTLAWVLIAVIAGIASHGAVDLAGIGMSLASTALFLALSLTIGRGLVARVIRWTNDTMTIEVPVITAILVVMLAMALATEMIGVHTALGAFMAGLLIGQSPILTEHIRGELRGLIIAFFSPVFFAVAGLAMDLRTLLDPALLGWTLVIIAVASLGKFLGAFIGGRVGGLEGIESLALATGLNARGSTEVIVASIGLSMGAFGTELYTMIVAMAIVTTMIMPPTLRWVLERVPLHESEARRLEREEAEERESVPQMERALLLADRSPNGALAAGLAGMFAASRQVVTTVMMPAADMGAAKGTPLCLVRSAAGATVARLAAAADAAETQRLPLAELIHAKAGDNPTPSGGEAMRELAKGYSIAFIGLEQPLHASASQLEHSLSALADGFDGPLAIVLNGHRLDPGPERPLRILVPTGGKPEARVATEIALALTKASNGSMTALHVYDPRDDYDIASGRGRRSGLSVLVDARRLGKHSGVPVKGLTMVNSRPEIAILKTAHAGRYDLVVVGTALRQVPERFLGSRSAILMRNITKPVLLVTR